MSQPTALGAGASPPCASLVELLSERAREQGDKVAFRLLRAERGDESSLTYRDLHERARSIAGTLQARLRPQARALLLYPPGLEFIEAFFGCLFAGVVAVPVAVPGRARHTSSVEAICEAAQPELILSTAEMCAEAPSTYAHLPRLLSYPWVATDQPATGEAWRNSGPSADALAFLQYTSGSTSAPKGVMVTHRNLLHNSALICRAFGNTPDSSAVFWLPHHHDMGLIGGIIQPLYCGGSCTLLAPAAFLQRPLLWLETISRFRATVSGGPDFAYELCARRSSPEDCAQLDLSQWQVAFVGAERIRATTLDRFGQTFAPCGFRREAFFPCYGLAESTLMVSGGPRQEMPVVLHVDKAILTERTVREVPDTHPSARAIVSCGESLPGLRVIVVDPRTCRPCGPESIGEIWVQGASVAEGYYQLPEATAETFRGTVVDTQEGPFLRTGDLGFVRDGHVYVTGRLKDLIIIRGRNYYPEDIEHAVERAHESLRIGACAAFSCEVDDVERLVIVQELEPRRRSLDTDAVLLAIRSAVAANHDLEVYAIVLAPAGTIPKTSSGKTRRAACREQFEQGALAAVARWQAPADAFPATASGIPSPLVPSRVTVQEIEEWLIERVAARVRLPREQIRLTKPFLEFGMGSVEAVGIAGDLEAWLGRRLSPTAIYNYPTIATLAAWLANGSAHEPRVETVPVSDVMAPPADTQNMLRDVQQMTDQELAEFIQLQSIRHQGT